jgi:hypothetical protein
VGTNSFGQTVEHRGNLDLRLQHLEASLDVGQAFVSVDDLGGLEVGHVGYQQQLAVHHLRPCQRLGVDVVGEEI